MPQASCLNTNRKVWHRNVKIYSTIGCMYRATHYTIKLHDYCIPYVGQKHKVQVGSSIKPLIELNVVNLIKCSVCTWRRWTPIIGAPCILVKVCFKQLNHTSTPFWRGGIKALPDTKPTNKASRSFCHNRLKKNEGITLNSLQ